MNSKPEETYYDVLKVDSKATIAEIVAAYHSAKNAFSRDSVATYSLFSPEEVQVILDRLEQAFLHLSNLDRKREYDRRLEERAQNGEVPSMTELERKQNAQLLPKDAESGKGGMGSMTSPIPPLTTSDLTPFSSENITGPLFREVREKRALSQDDVCRITKIPLKFIQAIEADNMKGLPARVYLQGFVKNMANLYRLDPKLASKAYLEYIDQKTLEAKSS